jgi:mono/diheme cytochrome c family protein
MPAFKDQLSADEIRQITYYLQVLRGERAPEPPPK